MNDHIKDVTKRLASEGFAALAVDMYDGKVTKDPEEAKCFMMSMDKAAALEKLSEKVCDTLRLVHASDLRERVTKRYRPR